MGIERDYCTQFINEDATVTTGRDTERDYSGLCLKGKKEKVMAILRDMEAQYGKDARIIDVIADLEKEESVCEDEQEDLEDIKAHPDKYFLVKEDEWTTMADVDAVGKYSKDGKVKIYIQSSTMDDFDIVVKDTEKSMEIFPSADEALEALVEFLRDNTEDYMEAYPEAMERFMKDLEDNQIDSEGVLQYMSDLHDAEIGDYTFLKEVGEFQVSEF